MVAELGSEHMKRSKNLITSSSNEVQLHQAIADRKESTGIKTRVKREIGIDRGNASGSGKAATETTRAPLATETDTDTEAGPEQEAADTMTEAQGNPRQLQAAFNPPHNVCSGEEAPDSLLSMARDVIRL